MRRLVLAAACMVLLLGCAGTPKPKVPNATPAPEASASPEASPTPSPSPSASPTKAPKIKKIKVPVVAKEMRYVDKGTLDQYTIYYYDSDNKYLLNKQVFDGQRSAPISRTVYEYTDKGELALESTYATDKAPKSKISYKYNPLSQLIEENRIDETGAILMSSRYTYTPTGKKLDWKIYLGGEVLAAETIYEYTKEELSRIVMKGGHNEYLSAINITRDKKGRETVRENRTVRNIIESFNEYEYAGDRLSKETDTGPSGKLLQTVYYEYDAGSSVPKKKTIKNPAGKVKEYTTYEYAYKEEEVPLE